MNHPRNELYQIISLLIVTLKIESFFTNIVSKIRLYHLFEYFIISGTAYWMNE